MFSNGKTPTITIPMISSGIVFSGDKTPLKKQNAPSRKIVIRLNPSKYFQNFSTTTLPGSTGTAHNVVHSVVNHPHPAEGELRTL